MKYIITALTFLISLQSGAKSIVDESKSICVIRDFIDNVNSDLLNLELVKNEKLGPGYDTQELKYKNYHITYTIGTRHLSLEKNGKLVSSAKSTIKSGGSLYVTSFNDKGEPETEVSCKLVY